MAVASRPMTVTSQWTTDQAAETLLRRLGVAYEYVSQIPVNLIDADRSLQNQARLGVRLNSEDVEEFAIHMLDGDTFPALVAFPLANGTYVLAGGNHRLAAAREARITLVDLYLVRTNDEGMRRLITTTLNTVVGRRPSREETIEQALGWMERFARSVKFTAAAYGLPEAALTRELKVRAARKRIQLAGVPSGVMARSHELTLASIQNDIVLRDAAALQEEFMLPESELRQFVGEIRDHRTEAAQLAVVQQWRDRDDLKIRKAERQRPGGQRPPAFVLARSEIFRGLNSANGVLGRCVSRGQAGLSNDDDYARALAAARSCTERLERLGATLI